MLSRKLISVILVATVLAQAPFENVFALRKILDNCRARSWLLIISAL